MHLVYKVNQFIVEYKCNKLFHLILGVVICVIIIMITGNEYYNS